MTLFDWRSSSLANWHTDPEKQYIQVKKFNASYFQRTTSNQKVSQKRLFLEIMFTVEMTIAVNIGSILLVNCKITDFRKRVYFRKNLQCPFANEDDLQSKTVIKDFVFRIVFYIGMDYRRNYCNHFACVLQNHRSQKKT